MHHFRILPTDERFKQLTEKQKLLLFYGWTELPSSDQIKVYYDRKEETPVINADDEENFKRIGYTSKQIAKMKEQLENAGYHQSD